MEIFDKEILESLEKLEDYESEMINYLILRLDLAYIRCFKKTYNRFIHQKSFNLKLENQLLEKFVSIFGYNYITSPSIFLKHATKFEENSQQFTYFVFNNKKK